MLPRKTLAYVNVPSVVDLVEAFKETNVGRMIVDPEIRPFAQGLLDAANSALLEVNERTGLSLDELARIPQGEITLALLPVDEDGPNTVAFVAMVDCGESIESARKFRENIQKMLERAGSPRQDQVVDGFTISIFQMQGDGRSPLVSMERDNTLVFCSNVSAAKQLLGRWSGEVDDCLAQNRKFSSIIDRSRGTRDEPPQILFYADPIAIVTQTTKNNAAARIGLS